MGVAATLRALPHWLLLVIPAAALSALVLIAYVMAFGRPVAVKIVCLAATIVALATPGLALGYANGTIGQMGQGGTLEQKATVANVKSVLQHPVPNKPVNILLLGIDHAGGGESGRSDSQILVRLDPQAKTISMLSLPRDLRTYIPGRGYDKMNAAYSYGGVKLAVKTFSSVTGLPINHFIRIDFSGFWQVVDLLGGVYLPIDHRYYNSPHSSFKSIDLQPGYQLVKAKQALNFVRFRHDQQGDFTRMVRQQLFLREVQRQAVRWSGSWTKVVKMARSISKLTTTDLDSLKQFLAIVNMGLTLDTSHIYQVHVVGRTPTIGGVSYVVASSHEIAKAVDRFKHPKAQTHTSSAAQTSFAVTVSASPGSSPLVSATAARLQEHGYLAWAQPGSGERRSVTSIEAPRDLAPAARALARILAPARVVLDRRSASASAMIVVSLGTSARLDDSAGTSTKHSSTGAGHVHRDWPAWRALGEKTSLKLEAPTIWASGLAYDTGGTAFRAYMLRTSKGKRVGAAIAVGTVAGGVWGTTEYWGVQALAWADPPAIAHPSETRTIGGRTYLLFYQGKQLHLVAWRENGTTYWVINTLDDLLSNHLMLALAESCRPVSR
ncbi:MAG TPA: LCP family protein [Thermoleophilia bacterium]|nr:LCP family protein [Thermoleophilia bacterium]